MNNKHQYLESQTSKKELQSPSKRRSLPTNFLAKKQLFPKTHSKITTKHIDSLTLIHKTDSEHNDSNISENQNKKSSKSQSGKENQPWIEEPADPMALESVTKALNSKNPP